MQLKLTLFDIGLHVGQIKLIFQPYISPEAAKRHNPRPHLAFVEWFKVKPQADPDINMFMASKEWRGEDRACDIVPLEDIVQPCPLVPRFGTTVAALEIKMGQEIDMHNALDVLEDFWINSFHSKSTYQTVF